jgi:hypothetical protein
MISAFDTTKSQLYHAAPVHFSFVRGSHIAAFALSALVLTGALVVLGGWGRSLPVLTTPGAGGVAMNPRGARTHTGDAHVT